MIPRRQRYLTYSFFLLLSLLTSPTFSQSTSASYTSRIDSVLRLVQPRTFDGVVLIAQHGKILYTATHGLADLQHNIPLRMEDNFFILSVTKQITAVLVLQLVDKGLISLDAPIKKYLPNLQRHWADTVTVHQLLNHTSGITDIDEPLASPPGTHFAYSNLGYGLLGEITASVTHTSYPKQAMTLFKQCGMKHSFIVAPQLAAPESGSTDGCKPWSPGKGPQLAVDGYTETTRGKHQVVKVPLDGLTIPAGCAVSTAGDLLLWNECLHNGRLLQKNTYEKMTTASTRRQHPVLGDTGYGYGVMVDTKEGIKEITHTGYAGGQGFTSMVTYFPARGISLIILENRDYDQNDFDRAFYFEKAIHNIVRSAIQ